MERISSGDAEVCFEVAGSGPPVILLHPFPVCREFWIPVAEFLSSRYFLIMPDLRGHGDSELGEGPATMAKHAADVEIAITTGQNVDEALMSLSHSLVAVVKAIRMSFPV